MGRSLFFRRFLDQFLSIRGSITIVYGFTMLCEIFRRTEREESQFIVREANAFQCLRNGNGRLSCEVETANASET